VSPSEWQASGGAALAADALMGPAALGEQIGLVGVADVQRSSASVPGAGASAGGTSNGAYAGAGAAPGEPEMRVGGRLDSRQGRTFWVRSRLLVLIAAIWGILFWYSLSDPLVSVHNGLVMTWDSKWWLEILFALELLRQVHYLISEHWQRWNTFWSEVVFGGMSRRSLHVSDWARYRIKRIIAVLVVIGLVAAIAGAAQQENPVQGLFSLPSHLVSVFGYIAYLLFVVGAIVLQFVALFFFLSRGGIEVYFPDDIKTRFSHVWGQDAVLKRVKESIVFMEDPGSIESRGGYVPGGLLLWGPPGTGKTLMAEAVAGETGKPFVFVDPGAFIQMFVGIGPLKVKRLFRKLRQLSIRYGGVIVFFDEADSLGSRGALAGGGIFGPGGVRGMQPSPWAVGDCHGGCYLSDGSVNAVIESHRSVPAPDRSSGPEGRRRIRDRGMVMGGNMGGGGGMGTLQALLTEMSGLTKPRGFMNRVVRRTLALKPKTPPKYRILIMMATNMPNSLDEALLRPGRIDRIYRVGYPSKAGRVRTYEGYFGRVKHDLTPADIEKLATVTPYATGATIKDLVNESLIVSLRNGHERIAWADVLEAKRLKDLGLPEDVEYVERERHAVAIHEACHAVVAYRVRKHLEIDLATIEKGGTYLGMVSSIKPEDRFTSWRSEYEADVMVSLASLAGERQFFGGDSSSGVSGDLESATTIARLMESYWGMGSTIASSAGLGSSMPWPGGQGEGEMLRGDMGKRVEARLHELLQRADDLLKDNRVEVLAVAHALESHKTLSGEDVEAVIEGRQGRGIDGRPYKAPGFAEIFGAYHERLVNAHLARVKIATPLPRPVDWAPDLAADLVGPAANGASLAPTLAD
jgi:ATP-dependent Zn protease